MYEGYSAHEATLPIRIFGKMEIAASYAEYGIKSLKEEKAKAIDQINQLAVTVIKGKDVTVNAPYHEE